MTFPNSPAAAFAAFWQAERANEDRYLPHADGLLEWAELFAVSPNEAGDVVETIRRMATFFPASQRREVLRVAALYQDLWDRESTVAARQDWELDPRSLQDIRRPAERLFR